MAAELDERRSCDGYMTDQDYLAGTCSHGRHGDGPQWLDPQPWGGGRGTGQTDHGALGATMPSALACRCSRYWRPSWLGGPLVPEETRVNTLGEKD